MFKYTFRIRARTGMLVENLNVYGRDRAEAEKKLEQVYRNCEILDCREQRSQTVGGRRRPIAPTRES